MEAASTALVDEMLSWQLDLLRLEAGERARVLALLNRLQRDLVAQLANEDLTAFTKARLTSLLNQTAQSIGDYYARITGMMADTLRNVGDLTAAHAADVLNTHFVASVDMALPTDTFLSRLASNALIMGAPSADWWSRQEIDTAFRFANAVRQGVVQGETNENIVARVVGNRGYSGVMDISRSNARTLVHTSIMEVSAEARRETYAQNSDVVEGTRQVSTLDSHTTEICIAYDGAEFTLDGEPMEGTDLPYDGGVPRHWGCLPADALITTRGDVTGISKRWFDGEMVVIRTAAGLEFSCTPNHPILTRAGWVAARELHVGGDVIRDLGREWTGIGYRNSEDVPTAIHEVTEAFLRARKVRAKPVPLSAEDFHGDGVGSKIAIVWTDGFLWDRVNAAFSQHSPEPVFMYGSSPSSFSLIRCGSQFKANDIWRFAARGVMRTFRQGRDLFWSCAAHARELLRTAIAQFDTCHRERALNYVGRAAELFGYSRCAYAGLISGDGLRDVNIATKCRPVKLDSSTLQSTPERLPASAELAHKFVGGHAGAILSDEIVDIEVKAFHGYVFNLETVGGWYTANGILTHNCRSVEVPITKTFRELGIDIPEPAAGERASADGPVPAGTTFDEFLTRMGADFQDETLGPGRAELWRDGTITLSQLLDASGNPLTLDEIKAKYA